MPKDGYTRSYPHYPQKTGIFWWNFLSLKKEQEFCEFMIKIVYFENNA